MRTYLVPVLAALAMAGAAAPAHAEEITISVDHADLDLASEADARVLEQRIAAAAAKACTYAPTFSLTAARYAAECKAALVKAGKEQVAAKRTLALEVARSERLAMR